MAQWGRRCPGEAGVLASGLNGIEALSVLFSHFNKKIVHAKCRKKHWCQGPGLRGPWFHPEFVKIRNIYPLSSTLGHTSPCHLCSAHVWLIVVLPSRESRYSLKTWFSSLRVNPQPRSQTKCKYNNALESSPVVSWPAFSILRMVSDAPCPKMGIWVWVWNLWRSKQIKAGLNWMAFHLNYHSYCISAPLSQLIRAPFMLASYKLRWEAFPDNHSMDMLLILHMGNPPTERVKWLGESVTQKNYSTQHLAYESILHLQFRYHLGENSKQNGKWLAK